MGRRAAASRPYCLTAIRSASSRRKGRSPRFSARQRNFSRSVSTRARSPQAHSLSTASTGLKRPSSFITCSTRSLPEKAVTWVLPVVMSQKHSPARSWSR